MKKFWDDHKVLIMGAISAICVGLYGFEGQPVTDWLAVGYAAFIALGSYAVRNARGQWITILGVILGSAGTIYKGLHDGTPLDFGQLLLTIAVNIGMAATGPVKPVTYEQDKNIVKAEQVPPVNPVPESPHTLGK